MVQLEVCWAITIGLSATTLWKKNASSFQTPKANTLSTDYGEVPTDNTVNSALDEKGISYRTLTLEILWSLQESSTSIRAPSVDGAITVIIAFHPFVIFDHCKKKQQ